MDTWRQVVELVTMTILFIGVGCGALAYAGLLIIKVVPRWREPLEWWLGFGGLVMAICGSYAPAPLLIVMGSKLVDTGQVVRGVGLAGVGAASIPLAHAMIRRRGAIRAAFSAQHPYRRRTLYVAVALTCGVSTLLVLLSDRVDRAGNTELAYAIGNVAGAVYGMLCVAMGLLFAAAPWEHRPTHADRALA